MIDRKHSVDLVNGKKNAMYFKPGYMPSIGQIIPHNITIGRKLPIAMYVAVRSLSQADDTTNPENHAQQMVNNNSILIEFIIRKKKNVPKHMPHSPVKTVSKITHVMSPFNVNPKNQKLKISTNVVWPHIIMNCVETCEKRISMPVMPETKHRSSIPSFRSINIAPDVRATDKKKIIVKITPGAAKSVKFGTVSP